jgi:hypothetical protein
MPDDVSPDVDPRSMDDIIEQQFQQGIRSTGWYKEYVDRYKEEPDLNTPHYNYRRAWAAGARPNVRDATDNNAYHWPSEFKGDDHPNRYVDGVDTKKSR